MPNSNDRAGDLEERLDYVWKTLGFTQEQMQNKHKIQEIDYVLDDILRMDFLSAFNLKRLILIKQGISQIEGLEGMTSLEELWLNENEITAISGLQNWKALKRVFLWF